MNSLIFFVFIMGINIILKSIKEKKKIEESRRKTMQQSRGEEYGRNINIGQRHIDIDESNYHKDKGGFYGEAKKYAQTYIELSERYKEINEGYKDMDNYYTSLKDYDPEGSLHDKNAISTSQKIYEDVDIKNHIKDTVKVDTSVPKTSTFKSDVLKGIIFSEILGKPKSMQKKNI